MKKIFAFLAVTYAGVMFAGALTLSQASATYIPIETDTIESEQVSSCTTLTYDMRLGSRDSRTNGQVTDLQAYLQENNYLSSDPTGYFGSMTQRAVQLFQRRNNITPNGLVGPLTRAKIKNLSCGGVSTSSSAVIVIPTNPTLPPKITYATNTVTSTIQAKGPGVNYMSCSNPKTKGLGANTVACYGIWDDGNEFGGDPDMCPAFSYLLSGMTTGCVVKTTACTSGKAVATKLVRPGSLDVTSSEVAVYAENLQSSREAVKQKVLTLWEYTCDGGVSSGQTQVNVISPLGGGTYAVGDLLPFSWKIDNLDKIMPASGSGLWLGAFIENVATGQRIFLGDAIYISKEGSSSRLIPASYNGITTTPGEYKVRLYIYGAGVQNIAGYSQSFKVTAPRPSTSTSTSINPPVLVLTSPLSQLVIGNTTGPIATFGLRTATPGSLVNVRELRFKTTGIDAIESITVGGVTSPVVSGGITTVSGLTINVGSSGVDIPVTVKYAGFQNSTNGGSLQSGVSGVTVTLEYVEAVSEAGTVITVNSPVASNKMTLVASMPTVEVSRTRDTTLVLGSESKLAEVTVTADANGPISLEYMTFKTSLVGVTGMQLSNPRLVVGGETLSGVSAVVDGATTKVSFGAPYLIPAGSSKTFSLYGKVTGTTSGSLAPYASTLLVPGGFVWRDRAGGDMQYTGEVIKKFLGSSFINEGKVSTVAPFTAPTNGASSCSQDGKTGTISWTAPSGWDTFYVRVASDGVNLEYPAWDDNFVGTTKTFSTTPGKTYNWWVHTKNTADGSWSDLIEGGFVCSSTSTSALKSTTNSIFLASSLPVRDITTYRGVLGASTSYQEEVSCTRISKNIRRGDESNDTKALQSFLNKKGLLSNDPTGFYGDKTVLAVKAYQTSKGIPATGMTYEVTRSLVEGESCR